MLSVQQSVRHDCQSITRIISLAVLFVTQNSLLLTPFLSVTCDPRQVVLFGLNGEPTVSESGFGSSGEAKDPITCVCVPARVCVRVRACVGGYAG